MSSEQHRSQSDDGGGPLMDHEYDGIREYDNPLPGWWKQIFWATFVFSLGYFGYYHLSDRGPSVAETYAEEMRAFKAAEAGRVAERGEVTEAGLEALGKDAGAMEQIHKTYVTTCAVCHAVTGGGGIGPNLTDAHWINGGGTLVDIHNVISSGSVAKGMPAWGPALGADTVRALAAYVGKLRNTNAPGGKAPEGRPVGAAPSPPPQQP